MTVAILDLPADVKAAMRDALSRAHVNMVSSFQAMGTDASRIPRPPMDQQAKFIAGMKL